jgi:hypothetical protein
MKKIILLITFSVITLLLSADYNSFCDGFKNGYKQGYCYGESYCVSPIPPVCPIPYVGENSYNDGYNRGFIDGMNDK